MTDTELGKLVNAAFDEAGFVDAIRERLRKAVETVVGGATTEQDVRAGHAAGEELATLLIAQARDAGRARASGRVGVHAVGARALAVDPVERRATAFRTMAGVRL
jgi:hypothetical protein